jgi:NADH dehydrogenase (ubiquinone) Fe-S protein 6
MSQPPEVIHTVSPRVKCDGATDIAPAGPGSAAMGHPRVWLQIDPEQGWAECGYCDRRFVLKGGVADKGKAAA